jgi:hypothetical protein
MKRVAVFGNAGGGKSTLARRLAELTGLPLHQLDKIQYRAGGGEVPHEEYLKAHAYLLDQNEWIIDGFGSVASAWEHAGLYRPASRHTPLVGDQTPCPRSVRHAGGLADQQSDMEQHHGQLPGALAMPSRNDAQIQAACEKHVGVEAGSPREVTGRNEGLPRCNQTRICARLIFRAHNSH